MVLQHLLELPNLDLPEIAPMLLVDLGDLLQPRRTGDHLVDRLAQVGHQQRRKLLQHATRPVIDYVVREPGGQFRGDGRQRH